MRRHGLAYTAGVLACFAALAGALLALRAGGAQIGWGFQLQSPLVVTALAYVLFALGLSLSGLLLIGGRLTGVGHGLAAQPGYAGSFFTGALATVAATPCTAPFMGAAVGYALTQPPATALAVFEALGLGLALPFLALSLAPAWRRLLPRPGPWMRRLSQALAFPLYASVAWLVWVVSRQAGPDGVALVLVGLLLIAFGAWLHHAARGRRAAMAPRRYRHRPPQRRGGDRARPARRGEPPRGVPHRRARGGGVGALLAGPARRAARAGQAGVRELHRGLVHHVPRQRARRAALARGGRGLRPQGRGVPQGRLDQP